MTDEKPEDVKTPGPEDVPSHELIEEVSREIDDPEAETPGGLEPDA